MRLEDMRKGALIWSIVQGSERVVDRLLKMVKSLPEVTGELYVTINHVPVCMMDYSLAGLSAIEESRCSHRSLNQAIQNCKSLKAAFPGAIVAVRAGSCPNRCVAPKKRGNAAPKYSLAC